MATPLTITYDRMRLKQVRLYRDGAGPVTAQGDYDIQSASGQLLASRVIDFALTAGVQNTLNALWDAGVTQINNKEGTTSAS